MPHTAGKKISGSHTSLIDVAYPVIEAANRLDVVSKIVLGVIRKSGSPSASKRLKIQSIPAGLRVKIRGPKSVQELFIYTSNRSSTVSAITQIFGE